MTFRNSVIRVIVPALLLLLASGLETILCAPVLPGNIVTFAGTQAGLAFPIDVTFDRAGNLFIADSVNQAVRRVDATTRAITIVAGSGLPGFSGDGGPANRASLNNPTGVAVDDNGNLYISDSENNRIRKVDQSGTITTFAGSVTSGFGGDGGAATSASLNGPAGLAIDSGGNLYIADSHNNAIRKVDTTGKITTVTGGGSRMAFNTPLGIALDGSGNLYVADSQNNCIRKVKLATGAVSVAAGTGTAGFSGDQGLATSAMLGEPYGVRVDAAGNLYIADFANNRVRFVNAVDGTISTLAGNGTAGYSGDGGSALAATLNGPTGLALDAQRNLYIADSANNAIRKVTMTPGPITASPGSLTFSPQMAGSSSAEQTITLTNSSNATVAFSLLSLSSADFALTQTQTPTKCGGSLAAGASCTVTIAFTPAANDWGALSATFVYGDALGSAPQSVALNGTGLSGQVAFSAPTIAFGSLAPNSQPVTGAATIMNTADSTLFLNGATISSQSSGGFSTDLANTSCGAQLSGHNNCQIGVRFTPGTATGFQSATLNVSTSGGATLAVVALTATVGNPQAALSAASLIFGSQTTNTSSGLQNVVLSNTGSAALNITSVVLSGANGGDFSSVSTCGASLAANASCSVSLRFTPTTTGLRSATLTFTDNSAGSPHVVSLSGTGTAPAGAAQAVVNTNSLTFGYQNLGTTSTAQSLTLANPGSTTLGVGSVAVTGANAGDFSATSNCGSSLAAVASCSITVTFTPTADGARTGTLTINNSVAVQTISLTGTGSGNYSVPGCTVLSFVAGPNPIYTNNPFGITSINANVTCPYEVRIGGPNGTLFATGNGYSSTLTGNWVTSGLSFFLQQAGNKTAGGTLANLTVQVKTGQGCIATAFTASPNPIITNNAYGQTTVTAATNCSFDIHIGAPDGPIFQKGRGYRSMLTGNWVSNQMNLYLQPEGDTSSADTLSVLTLVTQPVVSSCTVTTFSAVNNPIITTTRLNTDTIQANANCPYDIRVGSPNGALLGSGQGAITTQTGNWVVNGLSFFLQLQGNTNSAGTLATFTVNTELPSQTIPSCAISTFSASPNPLPSLGGSAAVSVNANCAWDLRLNDAAGSLLASGSGAGSATVSSVSDGMLVYLQPQGDTNWQHSLSILTLHAGAQSGTCTALVFSSTPIVADASFGVTNITADATCPYDIRIGSPDGGLFGSGSGLTSANTGNWVLFGQVFYLQRRGDTTPAGTLATNAAIIIP